jgi:hypothetical protein
MNTSALITMVLTQVVVTALTGYFFYKVLYTKPNSDQSADK